jgi:RNA polymerase sigma-70 factor (ECF subfamily)
MPQLDGQRHAQFLRLYAQHEAALHVFVRALLPGRADADEALQETIVVLWEKFAEFDPARDFKKWAFGIARNKALAVLRDRARDRHIFDDELVSRLADEAAASEPRHLGQREALDACLKKLPDAQRDLVLAAYTKGTRMDELAAQRGQTPMALYKLLQRIRQALLECVRRTLAAGDFA